MYLVNKSQTMTKKSPKNFTVEKLLQAKLELHKEGFWIGVED